MFDDQKAFFCAVEITTPLAAIWNPSLSDTGTYVQLTY